MSKIAVVTHRSFPIVGGLEYHVHDYLTLLSETNSNFELINVTFTPGPSSETVINPRYKIIRIHTIFLFAGSYPMITPGALLSFRKVMRDINPGLIHTHNRYMPSSLLAQAYAILTRIPFIHTEHTSAPNTFTNLVMKTISTFIDKCLAYPMLRKAKVITAVSNSSKKFMMDYFNVSNVVVTSNFCNQPLIDRIVGNSRKIDQIKHEENRNLNVLFVGRLVENKGFKILLNTVKQTTNLPYIFYIAGAGPGTKEAELTARLCPSNFKYLGELNHENLIKEMIKSDVIINLSDIEGMCTVLLEAMYLKKYIIASDIPANKDILKTYIAHALIVPTPENIIKVLDRVDKAEIAKLSENSKYPQEYTIDSSISSYTETYNIALLLASLYNGNRNLKNNFSK